MEGESIYTDTMKENNTYHEHTEGPKLPKSFCVNPFAIPENYFEESARQILSQIRIDGQANGKGTSFVVPEGYFDQLQQNILAQTRIGTSSVEDKAFTVPDDYFGRLSSSIKNRIAEEDLKAVVKDTGFAVPEDYFEQAASQIQSTVSFDRITKSTEGGFIVEDDYFGKLTANITERISKEDTVALMPAVEEIPVRRIGVNRWIKYASAACILAILSLGVYFGSNNPDSTTATDLYASEELKLENISDQELIDYLAMNGDSDDLFYFAEYIDDLELENEIGIDLEDEDLEDYLKHML